MDRLRQAVERFQSLFGTGIPKCLSHRALRNERYDLKEKLNNANDEIRRLKAKISLRPQPVTFLPGIYGCIGESKIPLLSQRILKTLHYYTTGCEIHNDYDNLSLSTNTTHTDEYAALAKIHNMEDCHTFSTPLPNICRTRILANIFNHFPDRMDAFKEIYSHINYSSFKIALYDHSAIWLASQGEDQKMYVLDLRELLGQIYFFADARNVWDNVLYSLDKGAVKYRDLAQYRETLSNLQFIEVPDSQLWKFSWDWTEDKWLINKYKITKYYAYQTQVSVTNGGVQ
jgi:hypothetical protein